MHFNRVSKVHEAAPKYRYGNILWDLLPTSGASEVHPHIHVTVSDDRYHGKIIFLYIEI